jgi:uncharacterized membrane protein (UPF0182 family)
MNKRLSGISILLFTGLFITVLFVPQIISLYVEWLWFKNLQLEKIFTVKLNAQVISAVFGAIAGFIIIYINLWAAMRSTKDRYLTTTFYSVSLPQFSLLKHFDKIKAIIPLLIALFIGLLFSSNWMTFLYYLNAADFGYTDPIFNKDISFYLFTIPVLKLISNTLFSVLGVAFIFSGLNYIMKGALFLHSKSILYERYVLIHLSFLGSLMFLLLAFNSYITMHDLLYSSDGLVAGATYTDVHASIPFLKIQVYVAIAIAVLIMSNIILKRNIIVIGGIGIYIVILFFGNSVYPVLLQKFVVAPNELVKETPYIKHNISATRKAFGIDMVEERSISGSTALTKADMKNNSTTIKNIRLWDHKPLLDTFSQVQEIRTYYDFTSVDNDRYMINGEFRQIMLSPRELSSESIPTRNWINETLTFTHGYGLTLGPVNQVTQEGLPVLMVKDIPPISTVETIKVTRPEIYFGELSSSHVIVNTKSKEFDYPSGEKNVFTEYSGKGGVSIDSFLKKLVFAIQFNSMKLFLSNDIIDKSRILFVRNITERVNKAMPSLILDRDPYLVISDNGHLFWIYDAYTVNNKFPYSQSLRDGINYIRNSVKVTINSYDGSMKFYIADEKDPIIETISNIFPGVLLPLSEMPDDLRDHIRYPQDIFSIQTAVYSTYHMEAPQTFYNKEDQWEIPVMGTNIQSETMEPYYTIMKLPEEKKEEFILMLPFNPKNKNNLSAWMVARSDGVYYGNMVVYRFPKDRLVYGPKQIVARINQDTEISRQISLWDQRGSQVIQGTLLVIPIESSLIYVQPLYLRAETGKIPELKRIIVAYENRIAMEETLDSALSRIFGDIKITKETKPSEAVPRSAVRNEKNLTILANEHFNRAMKAQMEGNWALYGEEIRKLGDLLKKLQGE